MTNGSRTGAFWERHNKLMQDPEHAARFNTELARIRAVDAQVNADETLRTALTGFTEGLETGKYREVAKWLRAMLAAHPAPPVVDEAEVRERVAQDIEAAARTDLALGLYGAIDIARGATR